MNAAGKHARKRYGTRFAAKRAKAKRGRRRNFGKLPVSASRGNADQFVRENSGADTLEAIRALDGRL